MPVKRSVSVIICTRNRARQLDRTIRLLKAQDYPKEWWEVVFVDNRSTDDTREVIHRHLREPGVPLRYVPEPRTGVTHARNRGLQAARNDYVAYLDDDCSVAPDWLSSLMAGFDLDLGVVAVTGRIINDWGTQTKPRWISDELEIWLGNNGFLGTAPRVMDSSYGIREGNFAVDATALRMAGGFLGMEQFGSHNMAAAELKYTLWKLQNLGRTIAYVPQAAAQHHVVMRTRTWMIGRAYWQGISDGITNYLMKPTRGLAILRQAAYDFATMLAFFALAGLSALRFDQPGCMMQLLRASRRCGLILSELRVKGQWSDVYAWSSAEPVGRPDAS